MTDALPEYELFAIRYAMRDARRADHFIGGDPHDAPMAMDYFLLGREGPERTLHHRHRLHRGGRGRSAGRTYLRDPIDTLKLIGVDADTVEDVILTHLHYDHVGNFHRFPKAQFHLQEPEMHYATGRHMRYPRLATLLRGRGCGRRSCG